jgi:peptidyl-prolyl cis-trans isomerase B (cyclophilin B)
MNKRTNIQVQALLSALIVVVALTALQCTLARPTKDPIMADPTIIIIDTSLGTIAAELWQDKSPKTVENFLSYIDDGFFDGLIFHRVISGFMIQGGGFTPDMQQKATKAPVENEASADVGNDRGTLAMARTNDPNSATAQFFINHKDNDFLNHSAPTVQGYGYCVFGKVTDGMDVVDAIAAVKTTNVGGMGDVPAQPVVIHSIKRQ